MERRDRRIDGLRGVAALSVVLPHTALVLDEGHTANATSSLVLGMSLLFVVTGYLLHLPFANEVVREDCRVDVAAYARNRTLRLAPALLLVVCAAVALRVPAVPDLGLLLALPAFALVLPLLWQLAGRLDRDRPIRAVALPSMLLLAVGVAGIVTGTPARYAVPFALGMLAAVVTIAMTARRTVRRQVRGMRHAALTVLLLAALALIPATLQGFEPAIVAVMAAATVVVLRLPGSGVRRYLTAMFEVAPLRRAGLVSAGLVLWHFPVALVVREQAPALTDPGHYVAALAGVLAVTWLGAEATWRWVESPALRARRPVLLRVRRQPVLLPRQQMPEPPALPSAVVLPEPRNVGGKHRADVPPQSTSPST